MKKEPTDWELLKGWVRYILGHKKRQADLERRLLDALKENKGTKKRLACALKETKMYKEVFACEVGLRASSMKSTNKAIKSIQADLGVLMSDVLETKELARTPFCGNTITKPEFETVLRDHGQIIGLLHQLKSGMVSVTEKRI